jgi:hypothetical protein
MGLAQSIHKPELREAGWHSRGYLPHFDGRELPQFVSLHLFDSVPASVVERWKRELDVLNSKTDRILLQRRLERYLDQGYGQAFLKEHRVATMIQDVLLGSDSKSYRLSAWEIMQSLKSITSHKANRILKRHGQFWMLDYFDRYIRNAEHFAKTLRYIEDNPVKAGLCKRPEDWPFSSVRFRVSKGK